ncbi:antitoxin [Amycolatopsis sp. K13G38]|uniref:Antitoxin n=1 Tax=Amycolatopsis acididurans TaxID=2724524 RepID=A0ABX1J6M7_9PSEU|nr:antitoxin [Amycolatopsis acididurans]NKQ54956.1 antitoxin [Amycolatopsis acididurans]
MGINFDEIKKKAQQALDQNAEKIESGLDKASGFAKSKLGQHSDKIDNVTSKAKDLLHKQTGGGDKPGPGATGTGPDTQ